MRCSARLSSGHQWSSLTSISWSCSGCSQGDVSEDTDASCAASNGMLPTIAFTMLNEHGNHSRTMPLGFPTCLCMIHSMSGHRRLRPMICTHPNGLHIASCHAQTSCSHCQQGNTLMLLSYLSHVLYNKSLCHMLCNNNTFISSLCKLAYCRSHTEITVNVVACNADIGAQQHINGIAWW